MQDNKLFLLPILIFDLLYRILLCDHYCDHHQSRYGHGCVPFKSGNDTAILVAGNNFSPADLSEVMP